MNHEALTNQVVFAVKNRDSLINRELEERLYQYITGIVRGKEQKMSAINRTPNHIHFLIGMKPSCCLFDLVLEVKKSSLNGLIKPMPKASKVFSNGAISESATPMGSDISILFRFSIYLKSLRD